MSRLGLFPSRLRRRPARRDRLAVAVRAWLVSPIFALAFLVAPAAAQAAFGLSTGGPPDWMVHCELNGSVSYPAYPSDPSCAAPSVLKVQPHYDTSYWNTFQSHIGYVRFWIPYNALNDATLAGSACEQSDYNTDGGTDAQGHPLATGQQLFDLLIWNIQWAQAQNPKLSVDIQIEGAGGPQAPPNSQHHGDPFFPQPYYGTKYVYLSGLTTGGVDYQCGVAELFREVNNDIPNAGSVVQWEVMNEPDAARNPRVPPLLPPGTSCDSSNQSVWPCSAYRPYCASGSTVCDGSDANACQAGTDHGQIDGCGPPPTVNGTQINYNQNGALCGSPTFQGCGALEAAELWEIAKNIDANAQPSYGYRIAALTSDSPDTDYPTDSNFNSSYITQLNHLDLCDVSAYGICFYGGQYPTYWSVHDYNDPTAGGTADLSHLVGTLAQNAVKDAKVWVTESGAWLNDWFPSDDNTQNAGGFTCPPQTDSTTASPPVAEAENNLGCLIDGSYSAQANAANTWESLLGVATGGTNEVNVSTTQAYWFEFVGSTEPKSGPGFDSGLLDPGGVPRPSYCVVVGTFGCTSQDANYPNYLDDFGGAEQ